MQLISRQKANGSWELDEDLAKILCTNLKDIMTANPVKVRHKVEQKKEYNSSRSEHKQSWNKNASNAEVKLMCNI